MLAATSISTARGRTLSWVSLAAIEFLATGLFAPLPDVWLVWPIVGITHAIPKIFLFSIAIFTLLAWPKRAKVFAAFNEPADNLQSLATAAASASATLIAIIARAQLAQAAPGGEALACLYSLASLTALVTLILVAAPFSFWRAIAKSCGIEIILALSMGIFGFTAGEIMNRERGNILSEDAWAGLTDATTLLSYWILQVFDGSAFMDPATRVLGSGNFSVRVFAACSGYEGMILVSVFLVGYLLIFRRSLKYPNVLLLFPMAMGAIWLLNSLRIALLVYIGAHLSPDIALGGFHSQFGWICFLLIAITIMTFAQRVAFFSAMTVPASEVPKLSKTGQSSELNPALIYLAPFAALMAAQILTGTAAPHEYLLYPVKVVAVGAVLYGLRSVYARMWTAPDAISIGLGAIAGVIWIATDPGAGTRTALEASLSEFTPIALILWLAFRAIGTIVIVPIAEELAFRGFLYRVLFSSRFETIDFRAFGIVALLLSSALFGLMHDRWLAAFLAGLLYALIMIYRGRLSDAIAAHMTTNAVIFAWAISAGQWSLL